MKIGGTLHLWGPLKPYITGGPIGGPLVSMPLTIEPQGSGGPRDPQRFEGLRAPVNLRSQWTSTHELSTRGHTPQITRCRPPSLIERANPRALD
ncbi:hypothetical protein SLA2020_447560 [Shorea laevis]